MLLLIMLTLRIMSLTRDHGCQIWASEILRKIRLILWNWIEKLEKLLEGVSEGSQVQKFQRNLLKFSLLGKKTYDIDDPHLSKITGNSDDIRYWVLFSVIVHDNTPGTTSDRSDNLQQLLVNDKRCSMIQQTALQHSKWSNRNDGLDMAVKRVWSDYKPSPTSWTRLAEPNERWLQTSTSSSLDHASQIVSYNTLEGRLLVDGRPLGRLPREYIRDSLYLRIFGSQIFPVFSSNMRGMQYMAAREVQGHQLHFGQRSNDIVIRLRKDARILEAIPYEQLRGDFPSMLVEDYLHWLDLSSGTVELRTLGRSYNEGMAEWQLRFHADSQSFVKRGDQTLVDVRSRTASSVASILAPLEIPSNIQITIPKSKHHSKETTTSDNCSMNISLPRLGLHFFLNKDNHLECRELRRIVDPNQAIGTLIGLRSYLVLCARGVYGKSLDRIVIVPKGEIHVSKQNSHVTAWITNGSNTVDYLRLQIDPILGCLRGDQALFSQLYQSYLHAVTSNVLPDPLTGRTGTEEALCILKSQIKQVWEPPNMEVLGILQQLSGLTPHRCYYPAHLWVMQKVRWSPDLSFLSQHDDFAPLCDELLLSGNKFHIFHPEIEKALSLSPAGDLHLLRRAALRHSTLRDWHNTCGSSLHTYDKVYTSRNPTALTEQGRKAYQIASLIVRWPPRFEVSQNLAADLRRWEPVSGFGRYLNTSISIDQLLDISFASSWAPLRDLCWRSKLDDKYMLLFLFACIAFGQNIGTLNDLNTLLAFAFIPQLKDIRLPSGYDRYTLSNGDHPQESMTVSTLQEAAKPFKLSQNGLTAAQRRNEYTRYQIQVESQAKSAARSYVDQWPCMRPASPAPATVPLINIEDAHATIVSRFEEHLKNRDMERYLREVQVILSSVYQISLVTPTPAGWEKLTPSIRSFDPYTGPNIVTLLSRPAPQVCLSYTFISSRGCLATYLLVGPGYLFPDKGRGSKTSINISYIVGRKHSGSVALDSRAQIPFS